MSFRLYNRKPTINQVNDFAREKAKNTFGRFQRGDLNDRGDGNDESELYE